MKNVLSVPHIRAGEGLCSEASIAMVMRYYGIEPPPLEVIQARIQDYIWHAVPFMREYLETSEYFQYGVIEEVYGVIDAGRPAIIRIRPEGQDGGHTVVVVGYDDEAGSIYINDPNYSKAAVAVARNQLLYEWDRAQRGVVYIYGPKL